MRLANEGEASRSDEDDPVHQQWLQEREQIQQVLPLVPANQEEMHAVISGIKQALGNVKQFAKGAEA